MATLSDIISADWSFSLGQPGAVVQGMDDINQCILLICSTRRGSDPLRPTFGVNVLEYIDQPITVAAPELIRECVDQITEFEPRVEIVAVGQRIEGSQLFLTFNWRDVRSGASGNTTTNFNLTA